MPEMLRLKWGEGSLPFLDHPSFTHLSFTYPDFLWQPLRERETSKNSPVPNTSLCHGITTFPCSSKIVTLISTLMLAQIPGFIFINMRQNIVHYSMWLLSIQLFSRSRILMHYILTVMSEIIKKYIRIQKSDKTQIPFINLVSNDYFLTFTF